MILKNLNLNLGYITARFKVWGYRAKCKTRIENSLKVNGVLKSTWKRETKMLTVVFNPAIVSLKQLKSSFSRLAK